MENFLETIKNIRQDLLATVVCRPTWSRHCWYIKGTWHDSEGREHESTTWTYDKNLATGWRKDPHNADLYCAYKEKWAQYLLEYIVDKYEI